MYVAKAAITEDAHHVAATDTLAQVFDDGIRIRKVGSRFARRLQVLHQARGIEPLRWRHLLQPRNLCNDHRVSIGECLHEVTLKNIPPRGIGSRFEDGPDLLSGE